MNLLSLTLLFLTIFYAISLQLDHEVALHDGKLNLTSLRTAELAKHNFYRAKHRSPALVLNNTLNNYAQTYANYLSANKKFLHSEAAKNGLYGENLFWAWGSPTYTYPNAGATESWYAEVKYYNYKTFTTNNAAEQVGHFTAMVWKASTSVGFGYSQIQTDGGYAIYVVANYSPTPNVQGFYAGNVTRSV